MIYQLAFGLQDAMIASRTVVSSARRLSTLPIVSIARKVKVCSHETRTGRLLNDGYFGKTEIYFVSGLKNVDVSQ